MSNPVLAWLDLETTGLGDDAEIIEVALVVTDTDLNRLVSYREVRSPSSKGRNQILSTPTVLEMHQKSGLWNELDLNTRHGYRDIVEIDHTLVGMLESVEAEEYYLAGSGVASFDRRFIRRDFPRFNAMLHYSAVDMGILVRSLRFIAGVEFERPDNEKPHRAFYDVLAAIDTARQVKLRFGTEG